MLIDVLVGETAYDHDTPTSQTVGDNGQTMDGQLAMA